jgi:hypothetical protein
MRHGQQGRMRPCYGAVHAPPRRTAHVPSGSNIKLDVPTRRGPPARLRAPSASRLTCQNTGQAPTITA